MMQPSVCFILSYSQCHPSHVFINLCVDLLLILNHSHLVSITHRAMIVSMSVKWNMSSFISVPYFRLTPTQNYILHHARYYITYTPKAMQVTSLSCASLCVNHEFLHRLRITDRLDLCYQIVMEWIILSQNSDFTLLMLFWHSLC